MSKKAMEVVDLSVGVNIEMVWVKPGTFLMGSPESDEGRWSDEGPQHEVTISQGFYLGKYEVTQAQWEAVMDSSPWKNQDLVRNDPRFPAVYVSWEDVQGFIKKLNEVEGDTVFRLPTEAEWEYACRAGTTERWSFGDNEDRVGDFAWYRENAWDVSEQHAHKVGMKQPNPWGLYDMHGNVWEWVQDWHGIYESEPQIDPLGPEKGTIRVLRGSGYSSLARSVRSSFRYGFTPVRRFHCVGFRLLKQVS